MKRIAHYLPVILLSLSTIACLSASQLETKESSPCSNTMQNPLEESTIKVPGLKTGLSLNQRKEVETAIEKNNLGNTYFSEGKYEKSLEYYKIAFSLFEKNCEVGYIKTTKTMINLGHAFYMTRNYAEASYFYDKALEFEKKVSTMRCQGKTLMKLGNRDEANAKKYYLRAEFWFEHVLYAYAWENSNEYLEVGDAAKDMMAVQIKLGNIELAKKYYLAAKASYGKYEGDKKDTRIADIDKKWKKATKRKSEVI